MDTFWSIHQRQSFHLMEPHIRLVRRLNFYYSDKYESPQIDSNRPYGNTDFIGDVADILADPLLQREEEEGFTSEQEDVLKQWHIEVTLALQIMADTGKLEPGYYYRSEIWNPWILFTRDEFKNPDHVRAEIYQGKQRRLEREEDCR